MSFWGRQRNKASDASRSMKYDVIVVASVPVLILYPFIQKYYIRGVIVGSIKA